MDVVRESCSCSWGEGVGEWAGGFGGSDGGSLVAGGVDEVLVGELGEISWRGIGSGGGACLSQSVSSGTRSAS